MREQLAGLELPAAAEQQITVALRIIEHLSRELHELDVGSGAWRAARPAARRSCAHYGIGPLVAVLRWTAFEAAQSAARPSSPDHHYCTEPKARLGANRAALAIARKLLRRAHHTLRELDAAIAPAH